MQGAAALRFLGVIHERGFWHVRNVADAGQIDPRDEEPLVVLAQVHVGGGVNAGRDEAGLYLLAGA